jgi:hypothetical protein
MIKLRDHYFIAWLKIIKKRSFEITDNGIFVDINNCEYKELLDEYSASMKPLLKEIRSIVKELATFTSNQKN